MSTISTDSSGAATLYIYGGEAAVTSGQSSDLWTNGLFSVDLGSNWTTDSPPIQTVQGATADAATSASASPPAAALGALFALNSTSGQTPALVTYGGEYSDTPQVTPSSIGIVTLTPSVSTAPLPNSVRGSAEGAQAFDPLSQTGWWHGGHIDTHTQPGWPESRDRVFVDSLLTFDLASPTPSVTNASDFNNGPGNIADHTLTFVPGYANGGNDMLVAVGGLSVPSGSSNKDSLNSMTDVPTFDVGSGTWNNIQTSQTAPAQRINHCAALGIGQTEAGEMTWQLYIFGGQTLDYSQHFNDVWALVGANSTWVQVSDGSESNAPPGRAGHTCHLDGSQLVSIGGYAGSSSSCDGSGVFVFDLASSTWQSAFTTGTDYTAPSVVAAAVGANVVGGSGVNGLGGVAGSGIAASPNAQAPSSGGGDAGGGGGGGDNQGGGGGTHGAGGTTPGNGGTSSEGGDPKGSDPVSAAASSGSHAGAIAGGVAGGIAALAAILGLFIFCRRRRQRGSSSGRTLPIWARGHYRFASDASSIASTANYHPFDPNSNNDGVVGAGRNHSNSGTDSDERDGFMRQMRSADPTSAASRRKPNFLAGSSGHGHESASEEEEDITPQAQEIDVGDPMLTYGARAGASSSGDNHRLSSPSYSSPWSSASVAAAAPAAANAPAPGTPSSQRPPIFRSESDYARGHAWIEHGAGGSTRLVAAPLLRVANASRASSLAPSTNSSEGGDRPRSWADGYEDAAEYPPEWAQFAPQSGNRRDDGASMRDPRVLRVANPGASTVSFGSTAANVSHHRHGQSRSSSRRTASTTGR